MHRFERKRHHKAGIFKAIQFFLTLPQTWDGEEFVACQWIKAYKCWSLRHTGAGILFSMGHLFVDIFKAVCYWLHRLFSCTQAMTTSQSGRGIWSILRRGYFCTFFSHEVIKISRKPSFNPSTPPPPPFKCQRGPSGQRKANIPVAGQKSSLRLFVEGLRCLCKLENYTTNWINSETLEWQHMFICVYMRLGLAWGSCPPWVTSHLDDTSFADVADDRATFFFQLPFKPRTHYGLSQKMDEYPKILKYHFNSNSMASDAMTISFKND